MTASSAARPLTERRVVGIGANKPGPHRRPENKLHVLKAENPEATPLMDAVSGKSYAVERGYRAVADLPNPWSSRLELEFKTLMAPSKSQTVGEHHRRAATVFEKYFS